MQSKHIVQKLAISALQRTGAFMSHEGSLLGHVPTMAFLLQAAPSSFQSCRSLAGCGCARGSSQLQERVVPAFLFAKFFSHANFLMAAFEHGHFRPQFLPYSPASIPTPISGPRNLFFKWGQGELKNVVLLSCNCFLLIGTWT